MGIEGEISEVLTLLGYSDGIDKQSEKYVMQAYAVISSLADRKQQVLKECELSISKVAKEMGTTRQTLYNNKIAKEFVEYFIDKDKNSNQNDIKNLKKELAEKDDIIKKMMERDVELVLERKKIHDLEEQVSALEKNLQSEIKRANLYRQNKGGIKE